jgi:hypothetical protein
MTTTAAAHAIVVTIASNGDGRPATVSVTGPDGQWRAALNTDYPEFALSVLEAVGAQLQGLVDSDHVTWPCDPEGANAPPRYSPRNVDKAALHLVRVFANRGVEKEVGDLCAELLEPLQQLDEALDRAGRR